MDRMPDYYFSPFIVKDKLLKIFQQFVEKENIPDNKLLPLKDALPILDLPLACLSHLLAFSVPFSI